MRVEVNGVDTYYDEQGSGPPLVLVHGLGGSTQNWRTVVDSLAKDFRVIRYDLRGLGQSATPEPPYTMEQLVADLEALLAALGLERASLVGHSLGGAIVLAYAAAHPERVSAVVGVAAPGKQFPEGRTKVLGNAELAEREGMGPVAERHALGGLPAAFQEAYPEERAAYIRMIAGSDPRGYAAHCRLVAELDITASLGRIQAPVLLIEGLLDIVVPPDGVRRTASAIPNCELVELEGVGHIVPTEAPETLLERIRSFLGVEART